MLSHPLPALGIVILYELVVPLVWKPTSVAVRQFLDQAALLLSRWLSKRLNLLGWTFRRRYYKRLYYRHRHFNVKGLRTQGSYNIELNRVFVPLRIADQAPSQFRADVSGGKVSIWDLLRSTDETRRCLAIIGAPGSGKSTLLQHVVLTYVNGARRKYRCPKKVPVLLFLRDLRKLIVADPSISLAEAIEAQVGAEMKDVDTVDQPPKNWFQDLLRPGKCVVMLDGYDEVADREERAIVARWVEAQMERYGESRFLITSRPHGFREHPIDRVTMIEVQPFDVPQMRAFVDHWYLAHEIAASGKSDEGVRTEARRQANDFLRRLSGVPDIRKLTDNPLLLTMIVTVHRYRGQLPGRRVELYSEICDVLLGHWRGSKDVPTEFTYAQRRAAPSCSRSLYT